jgi:hypothetical protein
MRQAVGVIVSLAVFLGLWVAVLTVPAMTMLFGLSVALCMVAILGTLILQPETRIVGVAILVGLIGFWYGSHLWR